MIAVNSGMGGTGCGVALAIAAGGICPGSVGGGTGRRLGGGGAGR